MNPQSRPCRKHGFRLEQMDNEMLLYHPEGNKILQFNQTAALIWQLCDGKNTVEAITVLLQQAYPESAGEIGIDVPEIIRQFATTGCVEVL